MTSLGASLEESQERPDELRPNFLNDVRSEEDLLRKMEQWATRRKAGLPFTKLKSSFHSVPRVGTPRESPDTQRRSLPDDLEELAKIAIAQLKKKRETLKGVTASDGELVNIKALESIEQQLQDEAVFISILGRYNSGKTTLINALLGIEVLPVSDRPETATTLYIRNDNQSRSVSDVQLLYKQTPEASGIENVRECLESVHSGIRRKSKMMVDHYVMKISFSAIESERPVAYIVDTPGSNEVGEVMLQQLADIVLRTTSAYIYVMTYSDIKNKEDYQALRKIYDRDKDIFFSERLTIVITHYDRYFEGGTTANSISKEEIRVLVASTIESEIGAKVSPNLVFPVAGKWASRAKAFLRTGNSSDFNEVELGLINVLRVEQKGIGSRDCLELIEKMGKEKAAHKLLETSGISQLEKRIQGITRRLGDIWKRNIAMGCCEFLQTAVNVLEGKRSAMNEKIKSTEDRVSSARQVERYHGAMIESVRRDSSVYTGLTEAFNHDTDYQKKFAAKVELWLSDLKSRVKRNRRDKWKYSVSEIDRDVNEFSETAERQMKELFHQTKFFSCQRLLRNYIEHVSEKFGRLRSAASLAINPGVTPDSIRHILRVNELNGHEEEELSSALEGLDKVLEGIDLSSIVTLSFSQKIGLWVSPWAVTVINDEGIEQVIRDRRRALQHLHSELVEVIRPEVILYFFKSYCRIVVKELNIFNQQYEKNKEQVFELLKSQKDDISEQSRIRDEISAGIDSFKVLLIKLKSMNT